MIKKKYIKYTSIVCHNQQGLSYGKRVLRIKDQIGLWKFRAL